MFCWSVELEVRRNKTKTPEKQETYTFERIKAQLSTLECHDSHQMMTLKEGALICFSVQFCYFFFSTLFTSVARLLVFWDQQNFFW